MGMLDFIKNRQKQQETSAQQPKPETAKEMYTREVAQEKATQRPIALSPEAASSAKAAGDLYRQGTQASLQDKTAPAPAPQEGATAPQPMAQMSMSQGNAAPALSPTSAQQGTRFNEQEGPAAPTQTPAKAQEQAKRTLPRTTPSWER